MAEPKTIYCPICNRKVCAYDGKQVANPVGKCKKCGKLIIYNVEKGEISLKGVPERKQASGMRFY